MSDSRHAVPATAVMVRRAVIACAAILFMMLAAATFTAAPDGIVGRLLLIGVDGVCLAGFATLGLVITARWKREDSARSR